MNALDNARESRATDMLLNYETVKYFCNERFELAGYDHATRQFQVRVPPRMCCTRARMQHGARRCAWPGAGACALMACGACVGGRGPGCVASRRHALCIRGYPGTLAPPSRCFGPQAAEYWQMAFLAILSIAQVRTGGLQGTMSETASKRFASRKHRSTTRPLSAIHSYAPRTAEADH
jgi:hypothetical protein